jgi:murein DD-endopeptidase MepM/ murein hydrolase activator NlpD
MSDKSLTDENTNISMFEKIADEGQREEGFNPGRRQFLRTAVGVLLPLTALGGIGGLVAACKSSASRKRYEGSCSRIGSEYGSMTNPAGQRRGRPHNGIDIMGINEVIAAAPGKVIIAGFESYGGNRVIIYHGEDGDRHWYTGYGHMKNVIANNGDPVVRGKNLGISGQTGLGSGNILHLHFQIYWSPTDRVNHVDSSYGRIVKFPDGQHHENPHSHWYLEGKIGQGDILIPAFKEGKNYPDRPIKLTYPVRCKSM